MRHILFPIDFSPACDAMTPFVAALARKFSANVTILHVMESAPFDGDFEAMQHHFGLIRDAVRGRLQSYQAELFAGLSVDRVFKLGHPVEEIVQFADTAQADLIILPTHGRTRFRQLLLGSVTAGILHDTGSAVLTAAHVVTAAPSPELPRSILCAIDMSPVSSDVLAIGGHFAEALGASLQVVHVFSPPAGLFADGSQWEPESVADERLNEQYASLAREAEIVAPFEIIRAPDVADALIAAEDRFGSDLLVIGRGKLQGVLGRLRSDSHALIRRSGCPVLSY